MRRLLFWLPCAAAIVLLPISAWHSWAKPRVVIPGVVYRSGQPDAAAIRKAVGQWGIRTVINLRGSDWHKKVFDQETRLAAIAEAHSLGLRQENLRFQSFDRVARPEVRRLVQLLDGAPAPVLVHCASGVDRSGWAAAVARLLHGDSMRDAQREMSWLRGHFCARERCPLHGFFNEYAAWLATRRQTHDSGKFRLWVREVYCPEPYNAEIEVQPRTMSSALAPGDPIRFAVRVRNRSSRRWIAPISLGVRMIGPYSRPIGDPLAVFRVPAGTAKDLYRAPRTDILPGATQHYEVSLAAPSVSATYYLQFDMVEERVHWFSDVGTPGVIVPLVVTGSEGTD